MALKRSNSDQFYEFLEKNKKLRNLGLGDRARIYREVLGQWKKSGSGMPFIEWVWAHKDEIVQFILSLIAIFNKT